jgi:hypothetical protein
MASARQRAGSACLDTSAQARDVRQELLMRVGSATMRAVAYCKETVCRDGNGIRHPHSLVVAFASRELMALDPGDRKVCSSIRRRPMKILRLYEKSLDKDRGS